MPLVGLGTWKSKPGEVEAAVLSALKCGYRHIDCAACYGNEAEIGSALKEAFASNLVKRDELFVTSKLWNSEHANVKPALKQTLQDLGLDYLDLYLIHWPQAFEKVPGTNRGFPKKADGTMRYNTGTTLASTWLAMEAAVADGLTKHIGLSNFNSQQIGAIMARAKVKPAVLQIECHPYFSQLQLVAFARSHGIVVTAYSPLASGSTGGGAHRVPTHPKLAEIGLRHSKSAAQVALSWLRQRGIVAIPKSVTEARIKQNLDVFFQLTDADMAAVGDLDVGFRGGWGGPLVKGADGSMQARDIGHPDYPFKTSAS